MNKTELVAAVAEKAGMAKAAAAEAVNALLDTVTNTLAAGEAKRQVPGHTAQTYN